MEYKFCPMCAAPLKKRDCAGIERDVCSSCGFIFYHNPLPSVGIIMIEDGKCLLIKRGKAPGKDTWAPPSGFMELHESLEEAVLRELKEETNLTGEIIGQIGAYHESNEVYGDVLTIVYLVKRSSGELKAGDDAQDAKFFPLEKLPLIKFTCFQKALELYAKTNNKKLEYEK